ncbi:cyclin-dependent kinase inhibitor 4 isoform X2 [Abrus precatorius]|uniref:Cyclin-dependent kinase inhibitor 4 isoform X2 n=1 Tax=Abrus precatorius TaxID=3816 RepID=A0A8B8MF42_ABRPR|nr:cyclin-dependent kinase inhibitor 4 isoform X2 [Abrus precatorius]
MGKYMKKAKPKGELPLVESTTNNTTTSYMGVRTRAKTLALQNSHPQPQGSPTSDSYLQLRSRRLHKPPISNHSSKRSKQPNPKSSTPNRPGLGLALENDALSPRNLQHKEENILHENVEGQEASFGENVLDFEGRERSTRESTPCSLIRDPDIVRTPGSTTRPTCSAEAQRRTEHAARRLIPTAHEMDEFFAEIEATQQRQFIEKYNFDPVNEKPLPGRYEWEKLKS